MAEYVAASKRLDLHSCPQDFSEAYRAHVAAWADVADALASVIRGSGDAASWIKRGDVLDENIQRTWDRVEALAARYGTRNDSQS